MEGSFGSGAGSDRKKDKIEKPKVDTPPLKIVYASDLHIEINGWNKDSGMSKSFEPGDVLILAGDTVPASYILDYRTDKEARKIKAACIRFANQVFKQYRKVIMIMGNHEHYHYRYEETYDTLKEWWSKWPQVEVVENEVVTVDDVRFLCTTLWTDMNGMNPVDIQTCGAGMNDYHCIKSGLDFRPIRPEYTIRRFQKAMEFLESQLSVEYPGTTVLVTHHSPTNYGSAPQYRAGRGLNSAYYTSLEGWILDRPQIAAWVHGHTHFTHTMQVGSAWIFANQMGYYLEGYRYYDFAGDKWFEIREVDGAKKVVPCQRQQS
jgi:predicted MPP superfamily phosphohydrolase